MPAAVPVPVPVSVANTNDSVRGSGSGVAITCRETSSRASAGESWAEAGLFLGRSSISTLTHSPPPPRMLSREDTEGRPWAYPGELLREEGNAPPPPRPPLAWACAPCTPSMSSHPSPSSERECEECA